MSAIKNKLGDEVAVVERVADGFAVYRRGVRGDVVNLGRAFSRKEVKAIRDWAWAFSTVPRWDGDWKPFLKRLG